MVDNFLNCQIIKIATKWLYPNDYISSQIALSFPVQVGDNGQWATKITKVANLCLMVFFSVYMCTYFHKALVWPDDWRLQDLLTEYTLLASKRSKQFRLWHTKCPLTCRYDKTTQNVGLKIRKKMLMPCLNEVSEIPGILHSTTLLLLRSRFHCIYL